MSEDSEIPSSLEDFYNFMLIPIDQDEHLEQIGVGEFTALLDEGIFDDRDSFTAQYQVLTNKLELKYKLSPEIVNYSFLVDLLFQSLEKQMRWAPQLYTLSTIVKRTVLKLLLLDPRFIRSTSHYFTETLDQLFRLGLGISEGVEQPGGKARELWAGVVSELSLIRGTESGLTDFASRSLFDLNEQFGVYRNQEKETKARERKEFRKREPARRVDAYLDGLFQSRRFPNPIAEFLRKEWRSCLLNIKCKPDYGETEWEKVTAFTQEMIECYSLDGGMVNDLLISQTKKNISRFLDSGKNDFVKINSMVDKVNADILNKVPMEAAQITPFLKKNRQKHLSFSSSILKVIQNLKVGQWMDILNEDNTVSRCKIADYFEDTNEYLFVDCEGQKSITLNDLSLAYLLTTKKAKFIFCKKFFSMSLEYAKNECLAGLQELKNEMASKSKAERKKRIRSKLEKIKELAIEKIREDAQSAHEKMNLLEDKHKKEADDLRSANQELEEKIQNEIEEKKAKEAEKIALDREVSILEEEYRAMLEILSLEQEKTASSNEKTIEKLLEEKSSLEEKLQEKSEENRRIQMVQLVDSLPIGSWLSVENENGGFTHCKLAIIYESTGKYVFVNGTGIRVGDYQSAELVEMLLAEKALVLQNANSFDKSMEQIIKTLRS